LDAAVKAFTTLRERYPTFKALPSAVCRTALARLRLNDVAGALRDFNLIIDKYPKTKERELSLYQKAHILGKQGDNQGMAETFKLLLKDYPETSEKADANYWIGWVAFENKDYDAAPEPLSKARDLDKEEYFERASLRIILSHFNSEDLEATAEEVENYTKGGGKGQVPYDVVHWLGHTHYERATTAQRAGAALEGYIAHLQSAAKWLGMVCAREDAKREDFHELGLTYNGLHEYQKATAPLQKYLEATPDPSPRAQGLLTLAKAQIGLKQFAEAQKSVDQAAQLQPDGRLNAEAREVAGDILLEQQRFVDAAKMYEQVSLIIDDEQITPRAMEKAVEAYRKAGKEAEAAKLLNTLKSRYPEYFQQKNRQNGP
jgi:TolA-binding protein